MTNAIESVVQGVRGWLEDQMNCPIEVTQDGFTRVYFFMPIAPTGERLATLRITLEALEDRTAQQIMADLGGHDIPGRLMSEPEFWPTYRRNGTLDSSERLYVDVDGRRYLVLRDRSHNVRITDDEGHLLSNHPEQILVLPTTVYKKPLPAWEADIRRWR